MSAKTIETSGEDLLSTFVAHLGLRSSVLGRVVLVPPWGLTMARSQEMMFHLLVRGECYFGLGTAPRRFRKFEPGDFVLFPRGSAHALASSPRAKLIRSDRVCYSTTTIYGDRFQSGSGKKSEFICGSFSINGPNAALLMNTLPEVIEFRAKGEERDRWICSTLELVAHEVSVRSDGSTRLIQQLLDTLFVQILRSCSATLAEKNQGVFAALRDPAMMKVLTRISEQYARPWTVEELARESGQSRTALAVKFQAMFGQGVATFLRHQRLRCARLLLNESELSIKEIAHRTGFASSEVFIRNFERVEGISPKRYRSQRRGDSAQYSGI